MCEPVTIAALGMAAGTIGAGGIGATAATALGLSATGLVATGAGLGTMGSLLVGATVAGAALSAYGSYQSGQAQKEAANYQAKMDRQRASMAEQQGFVEQSKADKQFAQQMGYARTAQAGSVLLESAGSSSADYALSAASEHAAEKAMIAQNAGMQAWGYSAQSELTKYQGKMAAQAGLFNAGGSLLSGIGQAGGMLSRGLSARVPPGGTGMINYNNPKTFIGGTYSSLPVGSVYS